MRCTWRGYLTAACGELGQTLPRRCLRLAALLLGCQIAAAVAVCSSPAVAQNACSSGCRAAYGACYKSTHDRSRCQAQLQRCLEGCIRSRHGAHRAYSIGAHRPSVFKVGRALVPLGRAPVHFGKVFR
jgi:hypothetical protein